MISRHARIFLDWFLVVYISVNFGRIHIIDGFSRNLFHLTLLVVLVFFVIFSLVRHCDDDDED